MNDDVVVVGSGPNGLVAAVMLARAGLRVTVIEANETLGGGARSAALTLPGFTHDVCASVLAMAPVSPAFNALQLEDDVRSVFAPYSVAHPLSPAETTCAAIGNGTTHTFADDDDAAAYMRIVGPLVDDSDALWPELLRPLHAPTSAQGATSLARFGVHALASADGFARRHFAGDRARALFAGCGAHAFLPLTSTPTAATGLALLLSAESPGWPFAEGGTQRVTDALVKRALALGVRFITGWRVHTLDELPRAHAFVFDLDPRQLLAVAGARFSERYRRALARYRYGPAAFKLDWALSSPIPWRARECREAACVHLGGTLDDVVAAEAAVARGELPEKLFVLVAQPTLVDHTRAPAGKHVAWAYAHVPFGCDVDVSAVIEARIEAHAPGFRDTILARAVASPHAIEAHNANCAGGHIIGGIADARQLFFRPAARAVPYATPDPSLFICSSSTPPGAGVHGMCGFHAADAVLRRRFHVARDQRRALLDVHAPQLSP